MSPEQKAQNKRFKPIDVPREGDAGTIEMPESQTFESHEQWEGEEARRWAWQEYLKTEEGQKVYEHWKNGGDMNDFWRNIELGENVDTAMEGGWGHPEHWPRRTGQQLHQSLINIEEAIRDPFKGFTGHFKQSLDKVTQYGLASEFGVADKYAAAAVYMAGDVIWGTVWGAVRGAWDIARARGTPVDLVHVASVGIMPIARGVLAAGIRSRVNRALKGAQTVRVFMPKRLWDEHVLPVLGKELSDEILRGRRLDGKLSRTQGGLEVIGIALEADEWLHELLSTGLVRAGTYMNSSIFRQNLNRSGVPIEQVVPGAAVDPIEMPDADTQPAGQPPETDPVETVVPEVAPDDETGLPQPDAMPLPGAPAPDEETAVTPDETVAPETPDAEVIPDETAPPETPAGEIAPETPPETPETVPDTPDPTQTPEATPESNLSQEYNDLLEQIASSAEIQAVIDTGTVAEIDAALQAKFAEFEQQIQALPEWTGTDFGKEVFFNTFSTGIVIRGMEIKGQANIDSGIIPGITPEPEVKPDDEAAATPETPEGETPETPEDTDTRSPEFEAFVESIASDPEILATVPDSPEEVELVTQRVMGRGDEFLALPEREMFGEDVADMVIAAIRSRMADLRAATVDPETEPETEPADSPVHGTSDRVVWNSKRTESYRVRYELRELADVIASHLLNGDLNPLFDEKLQPRVNRGEEPSLKQIENYAKKLNLTFLLDPSANTSDGAPILSKKHPNNVLSGNARKMALELAFQQHPDQWEAYQEGLRERSEQYGITDADIDAMQNPILVQVLQDDINEVDFADDANKQAGLKYGGSEQAKSDAKYLTKEVMLKWNVFGGTSFEVMLNSEDNLAFRQTLLAGIPLEEQTGFIQSGSDEFSSDGVKRIQNMMYQSVFSGEYGLQMARVLVESEFEAIKNVERMLDVAIPSLAFLEAQFHSGLRDPKMSISEELARAVGTLQELASNSESVLDFVRQDVLFKPKTEMNQLSLPAMQILVLLEGKRGAFQQSASVFMRYVAAVMNEPLLGEPSIPTGFTKEGFFRVEMYNHFEAHPPGELAGTLEGKKADEYVQIIRDWVDGLTSAMEAVSKSLTPDEPTPDAAPDVEGEAAAPAFPPKAVFQLMDHVPSNISDGTGDVRIYSIEGMPEAEITVAKMSDGLHVSISVPGFEPLMISYEPSTWNIAKNHKLADKVAKMALRELFDDPIFSQQRWRAMPNDPRLGKGIEPPTPEQQALIDKMPQLVEGEPFAHAHGTGNRRDGLSFLMKQLDPSLRIKTRTAGFGLYTVYLESDNFAEEFAAYQSAHGGTINAAGGSNQTALLIPNVTGVTPMDAVKRALADVMPDTVWEDLNKNPEQGTPHLDKKGVPGNQPQPLPANIQLVPVGALPTQLGNQVAFQIATDSGSVLPDYLVLVDMQPHGADDPAMQVTIRFPTHENFEDLVEFTVAETAEEAALNVIDQLREFELGKGGLGAPEASVAPEPSSHEQGVVELENLPPLIKSSEKTFGKLSLNQAMMKLESLPSSGDYRIYQFVHAHAPEARVRKMGTTNQPQWHVELRYPRRNAYEFVSYTKTEKQAIRKALKVAESDPNAFKPHFKSGIFSEIDRIHDNINRRQLATTPAIERRIRGIFSNLRRGLNIDFRGYTITSLKELAILGQIYRNPAFEAQRVFYLNANHEIIGHETTSIGMPAQSQVTFASRIRYSMDRLGAKYFVEMHNHPTGRTNLSRPDKEVGNYYALTFRDAYLGGVVVDTGEYAFQRPFIDATTGKHMIEIHNRVSLTSADLGWEVGDPSIQPPDAYSWASDKTTIRPNDPLFQYDVNTPMGKIGRMARDIGAPRLMYQGTTADLEPGTFDLTEIVKFGKYLQTEENWTTLFFTNFASEVLRVVEYKDLHLLSSPELWNFIATEAAKYGGVHVSAYIGKGDWYSSREDIENSAWGELLGVDEYWMNRDRKDPTKLVESDYSMGIEHAWFDGLSDDPGESLGGLYRDPNIRMKGIKKSGEKARAMVFPYLVSAVPGTIVDPARMETDYDFDTRLTASSPEREQFVNRLTRAFELEAVFSPVSLYEEIFGVKLKPEQKPLIESFARSVAVRYVLQAEMNPQAMGPEEASDLYEEARRIAEKSGDIEGQQSNLSTLFTLARLANITAKDRVLTMSDNEGALAAFARLSGAARVDSLVNDRFAESVFADILPGVANATYMMPDANLAREWKENRPTVILLDAYEGELHGKIDQAMATLAPGGRLVVAFQMGLHEDYWEPDFWEQLSQKYEYNAIMAAERGATMSIDDTDKTRYLFVDKKDSTSQKGDLDPVELNADQQLGRTPAREILTEIEWMRKARPPLPDSSVDIPFYGVTPEDQLFPQSIVNPPGPAQFGMTSVPEAIDESDPQIIAEPGPGASNLVFRQKLKRFIENLRGRDPEVQRGIVRIYEDVVVDKLYYNFIGKQIDSAEELAILAQVYRNPARESTRIFYLDENGQVLGHEGFSLNKRTITGTPDYQHIQWQASELGASKVMFLHNHPSASAARSSPEDLEAVQEATKALGDLYGYDVIIDSGSYSHSQFNPSTGEFEYVDNVPLDPRDLGWEGTEDPLYSDANVLTMFGDYQPGRWHIGTHGELAMLGRRFKAHPNWTTFAVVRGDGTIAGIAEYENVHQMSDQEFSRFVDRVVKQLGGEQVHVYFGEGDWYADRESARRHLHQNYSWVNPKVDSVWLDMENVSREPGETPYQDLDARRLEQIESVMPEGKGVPWYGLRRLSQMTEYRTDYGAPITSVRTEQRTQPVPPDDAPIGMSGRLQRWTRQKLTRDWYAASPQTAKQTLENLGATGQKLLASMKLIRNSGDRLTGRSFSMMDKRFRQWKKFVRNYAKAEGMSLAAANEELNRVLVRHQEGRSKVQVPKIVDDIVQEMTAFFEENIAIPMLDMNKAILNQGLLFDMPESLVAEGVLDNDYRKEMEAELPNFDRFIRIAGRRAREQGYIQGFVQHKQTGKIFAVRAKSEMGIDPKTGQPMVLPKTERYTLISPLGEEREGDYLMLHGSHIDYTLIALRDLKRGTWQGRAEAKALWDAEASNNQRPDALRDHFAQAGFELPEGVRFVYSKKANIEEWSARLNRQELFRIRRVRTPGNSSLHSAYAPFQRKLLVYDATEARDPIFIYRGRVPHKLWEPIPNYFPHVIDWHSMSADPNNTEAFRRFEQFVEELAQIQENNLTQDEARQWVTQRIADAKTRKYGNLEQDRIFRFPNFRRDFFNVWSEYIDRAAHRMHTIEQFGQSNDLLHAVLNEFIAPETVGQALKSEEKAVLKLRFLAGYSDFVKSRKVPEYVFADEQGNPMEIEPLSGDFGGMSPADWQNLVDARILRLLPNGNYIATQAGGQILLNPVFLSGALAQGVRDKAIAEDIVKNQLGWRQGDLFDEEFNDLMRQMRTWTGVVYLGRAWASNIAQAANTWGAFGVRSLLKSYWDLITDPKHSDFALEVGGVMIDVMHEYGGQVTLGNRMIRQLLGAVPRYQVGKITPRSFLPTRGAVDDMGVRTAAWTPFFAIERLNRKGSALAARDYAKRNLKQMVNDPNRAKAAGERLVSIPHATGLVQKLDAALKVENLSADDIDRVSEMLEDEVRQNAPELYPVFDFLAEFTKESADWIQHRVESLDRAPLWTRYPMFNMMQALQSFNIAQTKFIKDLIKREWRIMHAFLSERSPIEALKNKQIARAVGSLKLLPRLTIGFGLYGFGAQLLGKAIRFQEIDEEDLNLLVWLYKAGLFGQIGEYFTQLTRFNRGAEELFLGPTLGTFADVASQPARTVGRLVRPPGAGPSASQVFDWMNAEPERTGRHRARPRERGQRVRQRGR